MASFVLSIFSILFLVLLLLALSLLPFGLLEDYLIERILRRVLSQTDRDENITELMNFVIQLAGKDHFLSPDSLFVLEECLKVQQLYSKIDLSKYETAGHGNIGLLYHLMDTSVGAAVTSFLNPHIVASQLFVFYNQTLATWRTRDDEFSEDKGDVFLYYLSVIYSLQTVKKIMLKGADIRLHSPFGHSTWNSIDGPIDLDKSPCIYSSESSGLDAYFRQCKSRGVLPNSAPVFHHVTSEKLNNLNINMSSNVLPTSEETERLWARRVLTLAKVCVAIVNRGEIAKGRSAQAAEVNLLNYLCYLLQLKVPGTIEQEFSMDILSSIHGSVLTREVLYPTRKTWNDFGRRWASRLPGHFGGGVFESFKTFDGDDFKAIRLEIHSILSELYLTLAIGADQICPSEGLAADCGYEFEHEDFLAANIVRLMAWNGNGGVLKDTLEPFLITTGLSRSISFVKL